MKPAHLRLAACVVLFAAWMGYLFYLVLERPLSAAGTPIVLSRPQFLVSTLDVIARLEGSPSDVSVTVEEVVYPAGNEKAGALAGRRIEVTNVGDCRPAGRPGAAPDYSGPGLYILPLQPSGSGDKAGSYRVTPTPPSPGFVAGTPRIYPATRDARAQLAEVEARKRTDLGAP